MVKVLLEFSQKWPLLHMNNGDPFKNGLQRIRRQFQFIVHQVMPRFTLPGTCERDFTLICKNSEFWELHIFGILGALKFGIMGVHR